MIQNCNLDRLDFSFLAGFQQLQELAIAYSINIGKAGWARLPPLKSLQRLHIEDREMPTNSSNNGFADNLPPLSRGFSEVRLIGIGFSGDEMADRIIQWILNSSADTLKILGISYWGNLTRLPRQLYFFKNLNYLWLICQNFEIKIIEEQSLSLSARSYFAIHDCGVREIKPGAFQGTVYSL